MLRVLERHGVHYVVIGVSPPTLHGSPLRTGDGRHLPARDQANLTRLAAVLVEMSAEFAPRCARLTFLRVRCCTLVERSVAEPDDGLGELDIAFQPAGTEVMRICCDTSSATTSTVSWFPVASLEDVIRSKRAAGRAKDAAALRRSRRCCR